jgi:iron complex transport system substrate-binding protein
MEECTMINKRVITLVKLTVLVCMVILCSCGKNETQSRSITDMAGDSVELPDNIDKVICTSQNALEFMVAMGLEDKIIGIHKSIFNHTWSKEYIVNLDSKTGFGYSPTAEAVYEAGADLVIVKDSAAAEELRNAGIAAITFKYGNKEEMFAAIRMLGDIFGEEASSYAEKWISYYEETSEYISEKVSTLEEDERVSAYFIDASGALDENGLTTTVGGDSIVAEWFDTIGVDLVTKEYNGISSINEEEILEINPKTIIIGGWCENTRKEQLLQDEKWTNISAVQNGRIYLTPVGFVSFERYAVEAPILLRYSASVIYPELFDYDVITEFQSFFREFFNIEVSEEKIGYMLQGYSPDGTRMD